MILQEISSVSNTLVIFESFLPEMNNEMQTKHSVVQDVIATKQRQRSLGLVFSL